MLGTSLNINKEVDHSSAERTNNAVLSLNVITVIVNIIISAFEMSAKT